jgi:hypothetical protein
MNAYKGPLTYLVNPFITGKKWFVADSDLMKNGTGLNWYMRRDPRKVEFQDEFDSETARYKSVGRLTLGADTFFFLYGHNV